MSDEKRRELFAEWIASRQKCRADKAAEAQRQRREQIESEGQEGFEQLKQLLAAAGQKGPFNEIADLLDRCPSTVELLQIKGLRLTEPMPAGRSSFRGSSVVRDIWDSWQERERVGA